MRVVDFKDLKPDPVTLNHAGKIGLEMILNAFLSEDDDPPDHPSGGDVGTNFRGGSFEGVEANLAEPRSKLGPLEVGPTDPEGNSRASHD